MTPTISVQKSAIFKKIIFLYPFVCIFYDYFYMLATQMLDEGTFTTTYNEQGLFQYDTLPDMLESVMRDYTLLSCFKKDAHKMETFLKLLKCRQADKYNCA